MEKLFIIGNGFDLYHKLPSTYWNFKMFLQYVRNPIVIGNTKYSTFISTHSMSNEERARHNFHDALTKYIEADELWSNFEHALGNLDYYSVRDNNDEHLVSTYSEEFKDRDNHGYQVVIEDELKFYKSISLHLHEWIKMLNLVHIKSVLNLQNENSIYITFNYTNTLQRLYNISGKRISHIHGDVASSNLVCGHGDCNISVVNNSEDYNDFREREADEHIQNYFNSTYKDTRQIILKNSYLWNQLGHIREIHVMGHSLSPVDLAYFQHVHSLTHHNTPTWFFTYYHDDEISSHMQTLIRLGIPVTSISPVKMESYLK